MIKFLLISFLILNQNLYPKEIQQNKHFSFVQNNNSKEYCFLFEQNYINIWFDMFIEPKKRRNLNSCFLNNSHKIINLSRPVRPVVIWEYG